MLLVMRRVVGKSMSPKLEAGRVLIASKFVRRLHPGQVVIISEGGTEKVKRIERMQSGMIFVIGDNMKASTDSRHFGWLKRDAVVARVIWPNLSK